MNDKYAVISNHGGRAVIAYEMVEGWGFDTDGTPIERRVMKFQRMNEVATSMSNQTVVVDGVDKKGNATKTKRKKLDVWMDSLDRRQYESVVFSPGDNNPKFLNLWQGFAYEPIKGDRHLGYKQHVFENICGGSQGDFDFLWKWKAWNIQNPGSRPETAIALRGGQGTGKSFAVKMYGALWGVHYLPIVTAGALTGDFNGHLQNVKVVFADEAIFARDKRQISRLKGLITEDELSINAKGLQQIQIPNCLAVILASNDDAVINAAADERRYAVFDVSNNKQQDTDYFRNIANDMKRGGYENLMYELLNLDLSGFNVRVVPKNSALQSQKVAALSAIEDWWFNKLQTGQLLPGLRWPSAVTRQTLKGDFEKYAQINRTQSYELSEQKFSKFLREKVLRGPIVKSPRTGEPPRQRGFRMPSLDACRATWVAIYGSTEWEEADDSLVVIHELETAF